MFFRKLHTSRTAACLCLGFKSLNLDTVIPGLSFSLPPLTCPNNSYRVKRRSIKRMATLSSWWTAIIVDVNSPEFLLLAHSHNCYIYIIGIRNRHLKREKKPNLKYSALLTSKDKLKSLVILLRSHRRFWYHSTTQWRWSDAYIQFSCLIFVRMIQRKGNKA